MRRMRFHTHRNLILRGAEKSVGSRVPRDRKNGMPATAIFTILHGTSRTEFYTNLQLIEDQLKHHIVLRSKGGRTVAENCQMLCTDCNRRKSDT